MLVYNFSLPKMFTKIGLEAACVISVGEIREKGFRFIRVLSCGRTLVPNSPAEKRGGYVRGTENIMTPQEFRLDGFLWPRKNGPMTGESSSTVVCVVEI